MAAPKTEEMYSAIGFYHRFFHQRSDTWNQLKADVAGLAIMNQDVDKLERLNASVVDALVQLERIEEYTAFPSKSDFQYLWRLYHSEQYQQLDVSVSRVVRAISSGIYRSKAIVLDQPLMKMHKAEDDHHASEVAPVVTKSKNRPSK